MNKVFIIRWVYNSNNNINYDCLCPPKIDDTTKIQTWGSIVDAVKFSSYQEAIAYISDDNGTPFWPFMKKDPYISIDEIHPLNFY